MLSVLYKVRNIAMFQNESLEIIRKVIRYSYILYCVLLAFFVKQERLTLS